MPGPEFSAFCLAAAHSGSGKTTLAAGLLRACVLRGLAVQGFKCGPDYVDPTFHAQASGRPAYNVDTWMMGRPGVRTLFSRRVQDADVAVCEGVMGLLDGKIVPASTADGSTLDTAAALGIPLILVVNVRGMSGSIAALVSGFVQFASARGVRVAGIIGNQAGSARHAELLAAALATAHLPPLLGTLPRDPALTLPERQLGLVPAGETDFASRLDHLAATVEQHIQVDTLLARTRVPRPAPPFATSSPTHAAPAVTANIPPRRLAVARDQAFCFQYEENEHALRQAGWDIVPFSPLHDRAVPEASALYLCGGYPEIVAAELSANASMLASVRTFAASGKEIWAECGGYMYLCRELLDSRGQRHTMSGVLPATACMGARLKSVGYREMNTRLPFGLSAGPVHVRGHEFHWSEILWPDTLPEGVNPLYAGGTPAQGVCAGAVRAGYVHLYWAELPDATNSPPLSPDPLAGGRILLLNGPSSAGKTSLAHALRRLLQERGRPAMVISMDDFLHGCGHTSAREATRHVPVIETCHAAMAEAARHGLLVLADHVLGEDPAWLADLLSRLGGIPLHSIQVHCGRDELIRRERGRTDRPPDLQHALRQHASIHCPLPRQIEIDTTSLSPEACAEVVLNGLQNTSA